MSKKNRSGVVENLRLLYWSYGGAKSLLSSEYLFYSVLLSIPTYWVVVTGSWPSLTISVMPALAGFSIASFALFFSVLDAESQAKLSLPSEELNGRRPILMLASAISHAALVQIGALIYAIVFQSGPVESALNLLPEDTLPHRALIGIDVIILIFSYLGHLLTLYAILLVAGSVLSIFRLLHIRAK